MASATSSSSSSYATIANHVHPHQESPQGILDVTSPYTPVVLWKSPEATAFIQAIPLHVISLGKLCGITWSPETSD